MKTCYYLNDWTDEIMPCKADIQSWAEWLSKPAVEWKRPDVAKHGDTFMASATDMHEVMAKKKDGVWLFDPPIPENAGCMVVIDEPNGGWHAEEMVCDLYDLKSFLDEADATSALVTCLVDHHTDYIFTYINDENGVSGKIQKRVVH